jgi:LPXTG-motif cell wall-anchored protein
MDTTSHLAARVVALLALATALVLGVQAAPAGAQQAALTVSPSTAAPGHTVTFSGNVPVTGPDECAPGSVRITSTPGLFPPDGFGPEVPRDANGDFETTFTIPANTPPGSYQIGVRCGGGNVGISATLDVTQPTTTTTTTAETTTEPETTTSTPSLPNTGGSNPAPWIVVGVLLVLVGAGATAYARKHRTST